MRRGLSIYFCTTHWDPTLESKYLTCKFTSHLLFTADATQCSLGLHKHAELNAITNSLEVASFDNVAADNLLVDNRHNGMQAWQHV